MAEAALGASPPFFAQMMQMLVIAFYILIPSSIIGVLIARMIYSRTDKEVREKRKNSVE